MTKQELAAVLIERFKARGFKASQWHDRLYITKPTPDQANVCYTYGYVELIGKQQVRIDTTRCTSPEARAIAREKIQEPAAPFLAVLDDAREKIQEPGVVTIHFGETIFSGPVGEIPKVIDPDPGPNVHTDRHQRDMRSMQIETLRHNIRQYGAAYGCQVDDLVKLVEKDTAQRYEAIIAQRVAETVKLEITRLMPGLKQEALEKVIDQYTDRLEEAKATIRDAVNDAFLDIEDDLDEDQ